MGRKLFIPFFSISFFIVVYLISSLFMSDNQRFVNDKDHRAAAQAVSPNAAAISKTDHDETVIRLKKMIFFLSVTVVFFFVAGIVLIIFYIRKRKTTSYYEQMDKIAMLRMQNLRNRMSPHFFFNALSLLSTAVEDPERARINLGNLSLLLRKSIENIDQTAIPLLDELDAVRAYIDLQLQIIPGSFDFDIQIGKGIDTQWLILAMMIQVPVENAIKHGLMPLEGEKYLNILITREAADLVIMIRDNGIGFAASSGRSTGTGTGLRTLLQTIALLNSRNKNKISFTIGENDLAKGEHKGVVVRIAVPEKFSFN